jgi:alanyl-tRNA synthetase
MTGDEIRRVFLDFFEARGHTVVPSASLIPNDPTLLLTNAGMVPFKPYMLGEEKPPYPRAASIQKVARTVDIDIVGTTARHLTFFEMLGNFSFGDYFKEKAIPWAYELVTEGFGLDPDRLWYTVHLTDSEAEQIWIDGVGVPPGRVQRMDRDNFWQMGIAGPCGPSSEIFYDRGPEYGADGGPEVDDERFMEVWNLVFMQNIQDEPYHVIGDLPAKNIDTGAGLERIATVLQEVDTLFETDLVRPVMAAGEAHTKVPYGADPGSDVSLRILGDHGRAVTFLLSDGVVPSNEGRGYVLRRLLRRAVRHAFLLGSRDVVMPSLIDATVDLMQQAHPVLRQRRDAIVTMAEREEVRFRKTLESGHQLLDQDLADADETGRFSGATAFKLHDTYGFPIEVTEEILTERGIEVDRAEFDRLMQEQRTRARAAFKGGAQAEAADAYRALLQGVDTTEFVGYRDEATMGRILSMVREGETEERAETGKEVELFLDRTPFYAESGGQIGDTGELRTETGLVRVRDTRYTLPGVHGHRGVVAEGFVVVGQELAAEIDHQRRERIRKNHTGTHILHWALRDIVGDHVHQAGSLVADDRLRFDFSHHGGLHGEELAEIERVVNERIIANDAVTTVETTKEQAEAMGALMFFGDKYGDNVRVVKTGSYSAEFCGGTHVHTTGQVGPLVLVTEGSVAANTRRVEALTGTAGFGYLSDLRRTLEATASTLGAQPGNVLEAATALRGRVAEQEERLETFERQARGEHAVKLLDTAEEHGGARLLVAAAEPGLTADGLRALAYQVRDRLGTGIGVLGSVREGKGALIGFVSADLVAEGISAADVLRPGAQVPGGGGSRDPELAQAGGPNGDRIEDALAKARSAAKDALLAR